MKKYIFILDIFIIKINGISKVISTSKIKKITAIRKNCNENGRRADLFGSNPHSNGLFFSRSIKVFFEIREAKIITIKLIRKIIVLIVIMIKIIYTKFN